MNTDLLPREGLILCAVSGGMDSMYLLCRLRELGYPVAAAHYNHGLRGGESDRDETFVRDFCARRGIPFYAQKGDVAAFAAEHHLSVEDGARKLRYAFLAELAGKTGAAAVATAHTAEDNAETMLLHLIRGAGLRGLGGIPPARENILRPMLGVTREEVKQYMEARGIPHVEDSTNALDIYVRNRIRHEVMPVLRSLNPSFAETAGRTAQLLRRDEEYLSGLAESFLEEYRDGCRVNAAALLALPEAVMTRVVRRMTGERATAVQTDAVLVLKPGETADVTGMCVGRTREQFVFGVKEKKALPTRVLRPGIWLQVPEAGLKIRLRGRGETAGKGIVTSFSLSPDGTRGDITVTARREGDRFHPAGRGCRKSLRRLFMEKDVPAWERNAVPVLRDERGILYVWGIGPDERLAAAGEGDNTQIIEFCRLDRPEEDTDNA